MSYLGIGIQGIPGLYCIRPIKLISSLKMPQIASRKSQRQRANCASATTTPPQSRNAWIDNYTYNVAQHACLNTVLALKVDKE